MAQPTEDELKNMSAEQIAELQKQNCIFCKIISKEIPAKILHENKQVICILDINPASEGHILVIPKEHYMILPHVPEDTLAHLFKTAKLMSHTLLRTMQCKGTSIFVANGAAAGQKAPHVLIHVFPRKEGDGLLKLPKTDIAEEQMLKLKSGLSPYMKEILASGGIKQQDSAMSPTEQRNLEQGEHRIDQHESKVISAAQYTEEARPKTVRDHGLARSEYDEQKKGLEDEKTKARQLLEDAMPKEKSAPKKKSTPKKAKKDDSADVQEEKDDAPAPKRVNLDDLSRLFG